MDEPPLEDEVVDGEPEEPDDEALDPEDSEEDEPDDAPVDEDPDDDESEDSLFFAGLLPPPDDPFAPARESLR